MNILFGVHQFFPTHYTGTERYVLNLSKQLQKMGHKVKILTYAFEEDLEKSPYSDLLYKEYIYEGVAVRAVRHPKKKDQSYFLFNFFDDEIYNEAKAIIEKHGFQIFHCAHPLRIASFIKAAKDLNLKVVLTLTDYFLICPLGIMLRTNNTLCDTPKEGENCLRYCFTAINSDKINRRLKEVRDLINYCDVVLSPSKFLIALFNYTNVISPSKFILSPHGFDYSLRESFSKKRQRDQLIVFGYIGTVQYHKGVHIMIEGFKKVKKPNLKLEIWGGSFHESDYRDRVIKLAKEDSRIEFKGQYKFEELKRILQSIDVVIVPSIWYENAPLTIASSLAYGVPVIASDVGGMREAIADNKNGFTFKPGDPKDLAKIIDYISSAEAIEKISKTINYPITIEEEAFNTELVYKNLLFR
ncbi:MAG: glycosyltransferase family 4 protein [Thermodesulfovibrionales bacterium]|nr:glycosyltransferase family 4 protein [Thermodesulfovibrionales bacterium]